MPSDFEKNKENEQEENLTKNKEGENIDYSDVFIRYLITLQSGALIALGKIKNPITGKIEPNIENAREIINILGMFKQKTKGNLNESETKLLDTILTTLRLNYVENIVNKESKIKKENV